MDRLIDRETEGRGGYLALQVGVCLEKPSELLLQAADAGLRICLLSLLVRVSVRVRVRIRVRIKVRVRVTVRVRVSVRLVLLLT